MQIGPDEQDVVTAVDLLVRNVHVGEWEMNPTKIQGTSPSVKFLGIQWCRACQDIPHKMKDKLLHLAPPITKKEVQCPFGFWRQDIPHLGVPLQLISQGTQKLLVLSGTLGF